MSRKQIALGDLQRVQEKAIDDYWDKHYINGHLCSLCGNSGCIDTRETAVSGAGHKPGRLNYCICPNGRAMREANSPLLDVEGRQEAMRVHMEKMQKMRMEGLAAVLQMKDDDDKT